MHTLEPQVFSFVERFIILCPYLGESTIRGSLYLILNISRYFLNIHII